MDAEMTKRESLLRDAEELRNTSALVTEQTNGHSNANATSNAEWPEESVELAEEEKEAMELTDEELDLVAGGLARPLAAYESTKAKQLFRAQPNRNGAG